MGRIKMDDLISRKAVIELCDWYKREYSEVEIYFQKFSEELKELPSAQLEIIRCKDCKYLTEHYDMVENAPYWSCSEWDSETDYDGFCHCAERRTDE